MNYACTLTVPLEVHPEASVIFSRSIELSLDFHLCRRADRTFLLTDSSNAEHFDGGVDHQFHGRVASYFAESSRPVKKGVVITGCYKLEFEFEPFEDTKYPTRVVSPQPGWGRVNFTITCPCGIKLEKSTQTNLVRPREIRCGCGRLLLVEREQTILFSQAEPLHNFAGNDPKN
jgi:hypothetical protein